MSQVVSLLVGSRRDDGSGSRVRGIGYLPRVVSRSDKSKGRKKLKDD